MTDTFSSLDAFNAKVDAQTKLMAAQAQWNQAMMNICQQQLRMCGERMRLEQLRLAIKEYQSSQRGLMTHLRKVRKQVDIIRDATRLAMRLLTGIIPDDLRSLVWMSYERLVTLAPPDALLLADQITYRDEPITVVLARRPVLLPTDTILRGAIRMLFQVLISGCEKETAALREEIKRTEAEWNVLRTQRWDQVKDIGQPKGS